MRNKESSQYNNWYYRKKTKINAFPVECNIFAEYEFPHLFEIRLGDNNDILFKVYHQISIIKFL